MRCCLGSVVPTFVYLVALLIGVVQSVEEVQCLQPETAENSDASGIALVQKGHSVLPTVGTKLAGLTLDDGLVDDFAQMEDEFDDGVVQPIMPAKSPTPFPGSKSRIEHPRAEHSTRALQVLCDPELFAGLVLILSVFVIASRTSVAWARSCTPGVAKTCILNEVQAVPASFQQEDDAPIDGETSVALQLAIRSGDADACAKLLEQGGRRLVRQEDHCGCTPLHIAAHCGAAVIARLLIDHGADVDAKEAWDETPLHMAARSGSVALCELLHDQGADLDAVSWNGWTPLLAAGDAKQQDVTEFLLSVGAGAGGVDEDELPPLLANLLSCRIMAD